MVLLATSKSRQNYDFINFFIIEYSRIFRILRFIIISNFQLETPTAAKGSVAEVGTQGKLTMLNVSISIDFYGFHWFLLIFIDFGWIFNDFSGLQGDN